MPNFKNDFKFLFINRTGFDWVEGNLVWSMCILFNSQRLHWSHREFTQYSFIKKNYWEKYSV